MLQVFIASSECSIYGFSTDAVMLILAEREPIYNSIVSFFVYRSKVRAISQFSCFDFHWRQKQQYNKKSKEIPNFIFWFSEVESLQLVDPEDDRLR